ncbi:hypothetical protein Tco_0667553 [Tanacetum coccineum]
MVPSASKSSRIMNKEVEVEDHPRNLLLSKNKKHMSSECNYIKLAIRNDKSEIVYAMCKQCLITVNHDACVLNYVNGTNSHRKKQKANVSNIENQTKHKAQIWKPKNVGHKERLASPKPSKPRMHLRWSPTGKKFDHKGKIIASSDSNGDNAYISFLHVFGALCYPKNDREDIGKLGAKGDIGFFIGYSANSCAYRVYNRRTKKIMETMNVTFDELSAMAFKLSNLKPELQSLTSGQITMYDDHTGGQPSAAPRTIPAAQAS